jgi:hypothetical protein
MKTQQRLRRTLFVGSIVLLSGLHAACMPTRSFSRPYVDETTPVQVLGNAVWTSSVEPHYYYCVGLMGQKYSPECSGTRYQLLCVCTRGNFF